MVENAVKSTRRTLERGLANARRPELLSTVGGFAGSRIVEVAAYRMARATFGTNAGAGSLTGGQRAARVALNLTGAIVAAGALIPSRDRNIQGLGIGMASGFLWHALNAVGVNDTTVTNLLPLPA